MNQRALDAAIEAFDFRECKSDKPMSDPEHFKACIRAALTAYAEATGERVVWTNNTSNDMAICRMNRNGEAFGPVTFIKHGYELVERKVGT